MNEATSSKPMSDTIPRTIIALLLLGLVALFFALDNQILWRVFSFIVVAIACYEWGRLCRLSPRQSVFYVGCLTLLSAYYFPFQHDFPAQTFLFWVMVLLWLASPLVLWARPLPPTLLLSVGLFLLFGTWYGVALIYAIKKELFVLILITVVLSDIGAYLVGRRIGRHPLSAISPRKTWEGLAGGIYSVLLAYAVIQIFDVDLNINLPDILMLALLLFLVACGVLGDIVESQMKRHSGVKDSGSLLGAHGGVIDRLDSIFPVVPVLALLLPFV